MHGGGSLETVAMEDSDTEPEHSLEIVRPVVGRIEPEVKGWVDQFEKKAGDRKFCSSICRIYTKR